MKLRQSILTLLATFFIVANSRADILILQYGDLIVGKVSETNDDVIVLQQKNGNVRWPLSMVKDVLIDDPIGTTNRIPSWVKIISKLSKTDWAHDIKQIPATVIDNGILKNVPYISFRCNTGGYEINLYGDMDNPACVEIGAVGYNVKNLQAKTNCQAFLRSLMIPGKDAAAVTMLNFKPKNTQQVDGVTFEVSLPDEPDAYGGWWISIYDETALDGARASGDELLAITQPKKRPAPPVVASSPAAYNYWSTTDINTYARPNQSDVSSGGGTVYVRGYYRKNGTYVSGYTRHSPIR